MLRIDVPQLPGALGGGLRVLKSLIAEDDLMIADMVKMLLVDAGYEVCGIARTVTLKMWRKYLGRIRGEKHSSTLLPYHNSLAGHVR